MTENPDGSLTVAAGETVTVVVTKAFAPFAATFSPLVGPAAWNGATSSPNGLTETNSFAAPSVLGAMVTGTIIYDFRPDPGTGAIDPGDSYHQAVSGSGGGIPVTADLFPPGFKAQTLTFIVG